MSRREEDQAGQEELDDFDEVTGDDDLIEVTGIPDDDDDDDDLIDLDDEYDDFEERVGDLRRGELPE